MDTVVAILGFRPSAFAVAFLTFVKELGVQPDCVQLWASQTITQDREHALRHWISKTAPAARVDIHALGDISRPECVANLVGETRKTTGRVIFFADGGPNFLVAMVAKNLPADAIIVHCDNSKMLLRDYHQGQLNNEVTFDLHNLGIDDYLNLYNVSYKVKQSCSLETYFLRSAIEANSMAFESLSKTGSEIKMGLSIEGKDGVDFLFERQGHLYALFEIFEPDTKVGRQAARRRLRSVSAFKSLPVEPQIAVVSNLNDIEDIAAEYKILGILIKSANDTQVPKRFIEWLEGRITGLKTGRATFEQQVSNGRGGNGPPCVFNMGDDPSSTLVALLSHQPRIAYICYDRSTPRVVANVRQFASIAKELPCEELRFIPTDHWGRNLLPTLEQELHEATAAGHPPQVHCNVSPGTKAQSTLIARMNDMSHLWSIDNRANVVRCLTDGTELPKQPIPLLVQATMVGGPLRSSVVPKAPSRTENDRAFFRCFTKFLWNWALDRQKQNETLDWRTFGGVSDWDSTKQMAGRDWINLEYETGTVRVAGIVQGQQFEGAYHTGKQNGDWFELLVGQAFVEVSDEVLMGLEWDRRYPTARELTNNDSQTRAEVDVAARLGHQFFTAECKTSKQRMNTVGKSDRQYVLAVTRSLFGRFAIPFVVYPVAPERSLTPENGLAQVLDLRHLSDPTLLRQVLRDAVDRARGQVRPG